MTSAAVSGVPSANFASGRSLNVTEMPSGATSADLATEPVDGIGFILRAHHQAIEKKVEALRGVAFQDVLIERVVRVGAAGSHRHHAAALRRIGIDVVEMLEIRARISVRRKSTGRGVARRWRAVPTGQRSDPPAQRERRTLASLSFAFGQSSAPDYFAFAASIAFSFAGSIHQTCVGADVCDGNFAGRPKISQYATRS